MDMEEKKKLPVLKSNEVGIIDREPARCTGKCCRKFTMSASYERIQQMYQDWKKYGGGNSRVPMNDVHIVALMLVPLGEDTHDIDGVPFVHGPQMMYTCKHFDKDKGDCTIYAERPQMCREYPYLSHCRYEGCTYVAEPTVKFDYGKFDAATEQLGTPIMEAKAGLEGPANEVFAPKTLQDILDKYNDAPMCEKAEAKDSAPPYEDECGPGPGSD
jgi:Fe-S-cluster containining protein